MLKKLTLTWLKLEPENGLRCDNIMTINKCFDVFSPSGDEQQGEPST